jgi:hypothetical protein
MYFFFVFSFDSISSGNDVNSFNEEKIDLNIIKYVTLKNKEIELKIIKILIHPEYRPSDILVQHDIALIKIEKIKKNICNQNKGINAVTLLFNKIMCSFFWKISLPEKFR